MNVASTECGGINVNTTRTSCFIPMVCWNVDCTWQRSRLCDCRLKNAAIPSVWTKILFSVITPCVHLCWEQFALLQLRLVRICAVLDCNGIGVELDHKSSCEQTWAKACAHNTKKKTFIPVSFTWAFFLSYALFIAQTLYSLLKYCVFPVVCPRKVSCATC